MNASIHRQMLDLIESQETKTQFKLWHFALQRPYDINSEVGLQKYKVFKENIKFIKESNAKNPDTVLGLGPFTDVTWAEFEENYLTYGKDFVKEDDSDDDDFEPYKKVGEDCDDDSSDDSSDDDDSSDSSDSSDDRGEYPDWRDILPPVRDQKSCGSCWAFAVIGQLEGAYAVANPSKPHLDLSEQALVDCDDSNGGCRGGRYEPAYANLLKSNILVQEKDYPYKARRSYCKLRYEKIAAPYKVVEEGKDQCSDHRLRYDVPTCKSDSVRNMVKKGPVATSIEVKHGMEHYKQGKWLHYSCSFPNHAVVIVQFTQEKAVIRNSWGRSWGEDGHGDIYKDQPGKLKFCGAANEGHRFELKEE